MPHQVPKTMPMVSVGSSLLLVSSGFGFIRCGSGNVLVLLLLFESSRLVQGNRKRVYISVKSAGNFAGFIRCK